MLKEFLHEFDFKGIVEEEGIFSAILLSIWALFSCILLLPILFNEWSKTWFCGNIND